MLSIPTGYSAVSSVDQISGVWRRETRVLEAGISEEVSLVVWAQIGHNFADIRIPGDLGVEMGGLDRQQAFSGYLRAMDDSTMVFDHDLDTVSRNSEDFDSSYLFLSDDRIRLREVGHGFEEIWVRIEEASSMKTRFERSVVVDGIKTTTGRVLVIGRTAVGVWSTPSPGGALWVLQAGWQMQELVGAYMAAPELQELFSSASNPGSASRGWHLS